VRKHVSPEGADLDPDIGFLSYKQTPVNRASGKRLSIALRLHASSALAGARAD
jgi:hypothetical protein